MHLFRFRELSLINVHSRPEKDAWPHTEKFIQKSKVLLLINCEPLFYARRSSVLTSWVTVAMLRLYENVHYLGDVVSTCGTHSNSARSVRPCDGGDLPCLTAED